jgi:hypothetical protein
MCLGIGIQRCIDDSLLHRSERAQTGISRKNLLHANRVLADEKQQKPGHAFEKKTSSVATKRILSVWP